MKKGIIFDVDGTLWDSSEKVTGAWQAIIDRHPDLTRNCTRQDILNNMGKAMTDFAAAMFPGVSKEKQLIYLKEVEELENQYLRDNLPDSYDHVFETLDELSKEYSLYIVSNCQTGYIEICMKSAEIEALIDDYICFGDNGMSKSSNIAYIAQKHKLDDYYFVGDTLMDYEATVSAGGKFIFAEYGFGSVNVDVPSIKNISELKLLLLKNDN